MVDCFRPRAAHAPRILALAMAALAAHLLAPAVLGADLDPVATASPAASGRLETARAWLDPTGGPSRFLDPPDTVIVGPIAHCITVADTCRTISFVLVRGSAIGARGISVTFSLSPELQLCDPSPAIAINQGDWLSGFEPNIFFAAHDNGDGSFTVDQSILGSPCGATGGGTLFTADVRKAPGVINATGTITIGDMSMSDCSSGAMPTVAGPAGSITIDTTVPPTITGIQAIQVIAGNDADGTTKIAITFDEPAPDVDHVEVWRAAYGNYPEYDDPPSPGSPASLPALYPPALADPRWQLTAVTESGGMDEPAARSYWYYIAIAKDACGNPSVPVSLDGALNYHLGDVTPTENPGNNRVDFFDISRLGTCYFGVLDPNDPCGDTDVAPAQPNGPPLTNDMVDFEDLLVFAMNFGSVGMGIQATSAPGSDVDGASDVAGAADASLAAGPTVELIVASSPSGAPRASLELRGNPGTVRAFHVELDLGGAELGRVERGALLDAQPDPIFFIHRPAETVVVDAAVLGDGRAIRGDGEIAALALEGLGIASPRIARVDLRDVAGRPLSDAPALDSGGEPAARVPAGGEALPAPTSPRPFTLLGARPNPFNPRTEIRFQLAAEAHVALHVYDVGGHLVRALADATLPPGEHGIVWDGRDQHGRMLGSGIYFYTLRAGGIEAVERLLVIR